MTEFQESQIDAVVLGSSPTGLYALRELSKAGYRVAIADTKAGCAAHSKYAVASRKFFGDMHAVDRWLSSLPKSQERKPVLLPTSDIFIDFIITNGRRLSGSFRFASAYLGIAQDLLDKGRFNELCLRHGMPTPRVWHASTATQLTELTDDISFPCILKPLRIHEVREFLRGKKVLIVRSKDHYQSTLKEIERAQGEWMIQEIIPGPESSISVFGCHIAEGGEPRQTFVGRKLRQYPAGFGSASLVTSELCADTESTSLSFLKAIGFHGVCGVEFKRDPRDAVLKVIEINPRPTLWFQITHDAGKRIVESQVAELLGRESPMDVPQRQDVLWRYGFKDAASAMFYRRNGNSYIFPPPDISSSAQATRKSWPVYDPQDPLPPIMEPLHYVRKLWRRRWQES